MIEMMTGEGEIRQAEDSSSNVSRDRVVDSTSESKSAFSRIPSSTLDDAESIVPLNLIKLKENDFPDVCIYCKQCIKQIRSAIEVHTNSQIKDAVIAQKFIESAMTELLKFLKQREEKCEDKNSDCEHGDTTGHH